MEKRYVWLSHVLNSDTPAYGGGSGGFKARPVKRMEAGDSCNTSAWMLSNHVGTHVDAPLHFDPEGLSIDRFGADFFVFRPACLVEVDLMPGSYLVRAEDVLPRIKGDPALLLIKTGMGRSREKSAYSLENPGLDPALAPALGEKCPSLRAVGIDSISASSWQRREEGREAHRAFLAGIKLDRPLLLFEDMNLEAVDGQSLIEQVIALPLRVSGADGAPCTVVAEVRG